MRKNDGISHKRALVINGSDEQRYLDAVSYVVPRINQAGYEVSVVSPVFPENLGQAEYAIATSDMLYEVIQGIKKRSDLNDQLLVYTIGHGGRGGTPCLEDGCDNDWLIDEVNGIPYEQRAIVLTGCYSGDAAGRFLSLPRTLFASTGSPGEVTYGHLYHDLFWSDEVVNYDPYNGVSLFERCDFAQTIFPWQVSQLPHPSKPLCKVSTGYTLDEDYVRAYDRGDPHWTARDYFEQGYVGLVANEPLQNQTTLHDFDKAITLMEQGEWGWWNNPAYLLALNSRAFIKMRQGNYAGAIEDLTAFHRTSSHCAGDTDLYRSLSHFQMGIARHNLRDYQGAIIEYGNFLAHVGNHDFYKAKKGYAYWYRGVARYLLADYRRALDDYNQALGILTNEAQLYYERGKTKKSLDPLAWKSACQDFRKTLELNPHHAEARKKLDTFACRATGFVE